MRKPENTTFFVISVKIRSKLVLLAYSFEINLVCATFTLEFCYK